VKVFLTFALISVAVPALAQSVTFVDGAMSLGQFAALPQYVQSGTTATTAQSVSGTPGPGLATTTGNLSGQTSYFYATGSLYSAFTYNPAVAGAVGTIDFSIDRRIVFTTDGAANAGSVIRGRPLIEQGGSFYMAVSAPFTPAASGYTTVTMNALTQSSFGRFDYATGVLTVADQPNFAGSPMRFGFAVQGQAVGVATASTVVLDNFSDNFFMRVTPVPEPKTLAYLGAGLVALVLLRTRRENIRSRAER
jgi:PEP-CTERM motif